MATTGEMLHVYLKIMRFLFLNKEKWAYIIVRGYKDFTNLLQTQQSFNKKLLWLGMSIKYM